MSTRRHFITVKVWAPQWDRIGSGQTYWQARQLAWLPITRTLARSTANSVTFREMNA